MPSMFSALPSLFSFPSCPPFFPGGLLPKSKQERQGTSHTPTPLASSDSLLSGPKYDCLSFTRIECLSKEERDSIFGTVEDLLVNFLGAINYQHARHVRDQVLRDSLLQWGSTSGFRAAAGSQRFHDALHDTSSSCVEHFYPFANAEARLCMGQASCAAIGIDDSVSQPDALEGLQHFSSRLWLGEPQPEGWCKLFETTSREFCRYYGARDPLVGSFAANAWSSFADACCLEERYATELPAQLERMDTLKIGLTWGGESFPYHFRRELGVPRTYMTSIFKASDEEEVPFKMWNAAITDLEAYIVLVNDIMSFPKELKNGEATPYLSLTTEMKRQAGCPSQFASKDGLWTFRDTLHVTIDMIRESTATLDRTFVEFAASFPESDGGQEARDARLAARLWTGFRNGYIAYHVNDARYRLDKLRAYFNGPIEASGDKRIDSPQLS